MEMVINIYIQWLLSFIVAYQTQMFAHKGVFKKI